MYRIERQDQLYKTLPQAVFFSPTIVVFTALNLLLPLSGVFAPGSLTVVTKNSTDVPSPCMIPSGNLSTPNASDSTSLYNAFLGDSETWSGFTLRATEVTTKCLAEQRIPDLPQSCGSNCHYKVSVLSFVIQCTPNPSSLPYGQVSTTDLNSSSLNFSGLGTGMSPNDGYGIVQLASSADQLLPFTTLWNGTLAPDEFSWPFYLGWSSIGSGSGPQNGTSSGNASCSPFPALYDVEVRTISLSASLSLIIVNLKYKFKVHTKEGVQFVTTNITRKSDTFPPSNSSSWVEILNIPNSFFQFASLYSATRALFIGSIAVYSNGTVSDNNMLIRPSFLELITPNQFIWGDVLKGIEEMSHNVTAALLTLQLGNISSECFSDQQTVIYQYSPFELWAPYGVSHFSLLSYYDFTVSLLCFIGCLRHCSFFTRYCHHDNDKK